MIILGIETSGEICGAGLARNEKVLSEVSFNAPNAHSEHLYSCIIKAATDAGIDIKDLSGIAVSAGPGSFTGLRIGVSTAKGIAYANDLPLYLIPTLDIIAEYGVKSDTVICSIVPSIREELFFALYNNREGSIERITEYSLGKIEDIPENESIFFTGFINDSLKDELNKRFKNAQFNDKYSPSMGFIAAKLGCRMYSMGTNASLDDSEPFYLRDFDIKKKSNYG